MKRPGLWIVGAIILLVEVFLLTVNPRVAGLAVIGVALIAVATAAFRLL